MTTIISDKEHSEYTGFIAETLDALGDYKINGIALVALTDDVNLTAYWNMSLRDKVTAEAEIRYDNIDGFISANKDRYFSDGDTEG